MGARGPVCGRRLGEFFVVSSPWCTVSGADFSLDAIESRIVHVIRKRDDTGARGALVSAVNEPLLGENE